ncbi:MAG: class I SAM-dependent methyltransferase [Roseibium sp.]|uniref:class I SAM-dependent methyltransferase n=1 Tax=Roseibium sp. TaxID=1936156 RepID=UPI0026251125|nr:class I SAM-dependent methyltransferase [Roseibium sp.]MCV0426333.1 class I SAM-dependent methyltransferase [Roseibium sp.]
MHSDADDVAAATAQDDETLKFYTSEAPVYTASGKAGVSTHLAAFLKRLPRGAKILELGCGGGRDAEAMMAAGFEFEPTDGTPEIAARAEERLRHPVRIMRFDELEADQAYDAVWANASLLHVPRKALPGILTRVRNALKPGGYHFASYKGGGQEGRDVFGRYYNYLSREDLVDSYSRSGDWETVSIVEYLGGGYQTKVQGPWIAITARRPD